MIDVLVVGAGGWGREVVEQLRTDHANDREWRVTGFLDSRPDILRGFERGLPLLGDPMTYQPRKGEEFICALGEPEQRLRYSTPLLEKGGYFMNIRSDVKLSQGFEMGQGNFFARQVQISPDVKIGSFCNINTLSVISHDVQLGDYVQIGAMVFIAGGVRVGRMATVHPHATILPGLTIGEGATIGAGSVVLKDVPAGATVFGNPARVIFTRYAASESEA